MCWLLWPAASAWPQNFPGQFGQQRQMNAPTDSLGGVVRDTSRIEWFLPQKDWEIHPFADSTLKGFQQYDPTRQQALPWASLGNLGSAAWPLFLDPSQRQGFDLGIHAWDVYLRPVERIPYFRVGQPYTNLYYSQGQAQDDARFKAQFSRNFAHQVNFSLDHQAINNLGAFNDQRTRVLSLGMGLWWQRLGGRYQAFLTFAENNVQAEEPGRLGPPPADTLVASFTLATLLDQAQVRFANRDWSWFHTLRLRPDSLAGRLPDLRLGHRLTWHQSTFKYFDAAPPADSSFYRILQTDDRGLRHYIEWRYVANHVFLRWHRKGQRPPLLEAGLVHRYHRLYQEPRDSSLHDLFVQGSLNVALKERLRLSANAHLGLWQNFGEYKLSGELELSLGKAGQLSGGLLSQRFRPSLLTQRAWVAHRQVWQRDYEPVIETSIHGRYRLPALELEAGMRYMLVHNLIWWDSLAVPRQSGTPVSYLRLQLIKNFTFGPLHLDNNLVWQRASAAAVRLPGWVTRHSLYLEGNVFRKAMRARFGLDARFVAPWKPVGWMPLIGQFYLQEAVEHPLTPLVDVHVAFRVKTFRFFFKLENLVPYLNRAYYALVAYHYLPYGLVGGGLRFGLSWRLVD